MRNDALHEASSTKSLDSVTLYQLSESYLSATSHKDKLTLQKKFFDSIKSQGTDGIKILANMCRELIYQKRITAAKEYLDWAFLHVQESNPYLPILHLSTGEVLLTYSHLNEALKTFQQGLDKITKQSPRNSEGLLYNALAKVYWQLAEATQFFHYQFMSYNSLKEAGDQRGLFISSANLGSALWYSGDTVQSLHYAKRAYSLAYEIDRSLEKGIANSLYGRLYGHRNMTDSAIFHHRHALMYFKQGAIEYYVSECYYEMGELYCLKNNPRKAIEYFRLAIREDQNTDIKFIAAHALQGLGSAYSLLNQMDSAIWYCQQALILTKDMGGIGASLNCDIYYLLKELYAKNHQYDSAYVYSTQFTPLYDSLRERFFNQKNREMQSAFEGAQKKTQIETLHAQNRIRTLQLNALIGSGLLALVVIIFIYHRFHIARNTNRKLKEINQTKAKFFSYISQSLRWPIKQITETLEHLLQREPYLRKTGDLSLLQNNSNKINSLISQLEDLSKLEAGKVTLEIQKVNLEKFTKTIYSFFRKLAESKNIKLQFQFKGSRKGFIDRCKVDQIISNLLSNALKFSPEGSNVDFVATAHNNHLIVTVKDYGLGIPDEKIDHIWESFYQVNSSLTKTVEGSGIGLTLVKELTLLHHGKIEVTSIPNKGSQFQLTLPIKATNFTYKKIQKKEPGTFSKKALREPIVFESPVIFSPIHKNQPSILLVDDNPDLQNLIIGIFSKQCTIIPCSNGNEGLRLAHENMPQLIISDLMMPEMDGLTFCKKIKENNTTSHIPIIMLTAKADYDSKILGLQHGICTYLTKPFDTDELRMIVSNLLTLYRKELKLSDGLVLPSCHFPKSEFEFLEKINKLIIQNFHRVDFGIDHLAIQVAMSRMQLYRKTKDLTSRSPSQLLREYRLERAKGLLKAQSLPVREVVTLVGYNSHSNFSKAFRAYSGYTPYEFRSLTDTPN